MSNYKLYMGGYRGIQGVVIAVGEGEAEKLLHEKLNLGSLPCELEEIELPNHEIVLRGTASNPSINTKHRTKPKR